MGKPDPLCLLNLCGIVGLDLPARNKVMRGTLPKLGCTERYMLVHASTYYDVLVLGPQIGQPAIFLKVNGLCHVMVQVCIEQYILVHNSTYWYIL